MKNVHVGLLIERTRAYGRRVCEGIALTVDAYYSRCRSGTAGRSWKVCPAEAERDGEGRTTVAGFALDDSPLLVVGEVEK